MKYLIGFLVGLGAAWAALAIWQRVPAFPDIDADDVPEVDDRHSARYLELHGGPRIDPRCPWPRNFCTCPRSEP